MATYKFIDISEFQPNVNWEKIKAQKIDGVILRAGRRQIIDSSFKKHITGAINAKLHIGVYWFGYATNVKEAEAEAKYCLSVIAPYKDKLDCPVYYDWEYDSYKYYKKVTGKNATKTLITNMNLAFCKIIEAAGYKAGIYYNYDYKINRMDLTKLSKYSKWYAYYSTKKMFAECDMQQYTSSGRVDGIAGNVDRDYCYKEFWKVAEKPVKKVSDTKMPKIKMGSKGKAVKIWQIIVGASPDGIFGENTDAKTRAYQKSHNLTVDGIVGDVTWKSGLESVK